jgi:DNA-binding CsgD family transcriptional regulator
MDIEVQQAEREAPALLSAAEGVLLSPAADDAQLLDQRLSAAIRALSHGARRRAVAASADDPGGPPDADAAREQAVLLELAVVRATLRSGTAAHRAPMTGISSLLHVLRSFASLADLIDGAPGEVHRVGFGRVLLSRVQGNAWIPVSGSVAGNPGLARELVRVGAQCPGTLNGSMIETEVARRVKAVLVPDACGNARVHQRLRGVIDCRAYVSAPLVVHGAVAGLIHADREPGADDVDSFDRDLLSLVAEGLGFAIERVVFLERLRALRRRLDEHTRTVTDLIDEFMHGDVELSGASAPDLPRPVPRARRLAWDDRVEVPPSGLTPREYDVLRRMAVGETNAQIAHRLFVSEGTVKSHVKHILRKLDAANRAEAVSRYHLMMRDQRYSPGER